MWGEPEQEKEEQRERLDMKDEGFMGISQENLKLPFLGMSKVKRIFKEILNIFEALAWLEQAKSLK